MNKLTLTMITVAISGAMVASTALAQRSTSGRPERASRSQSSKETRKPRRPALQIGDLAPTFKLKTRDGKQETDIASFRGKRPIILFFGSYT